MTEIVELYQKVTGESIPIEELQLFLSIARTECINSILLSDFNAKLPILLQNPSYQEILRNFKSTHDGVSVGLQWAVRILSQEHKIDQFGDEIILTTSLAEQTQLQNKQSQEKIATYLQMINDYRKIEVDLDKSPKVKRSF